MLTQHHSQDKPKPDSSYFNPISKEKFAETLCEAHQEGSSVGYSILIAIKISASLIFEKIGQTFFLLIWINEIFANFWNAYGFYQSSKKNLGKTAKLLFGWLNVGFFTFTIFAAKVLSLAAQVFSLGFMLILSFFPYVIKAGYYLGKLFSSNNLQESEKYYARIKNNVTHAIAIGLVIGGVATLLLVPGLNIIVSTTLGCAVSLMIGLPMLYLLGSKVITFFSWAKRRLAKWKEKRNALPSTQISEVNFKPSLITKETSTLRLYTDLQITEQLNENNSAFEHTNQQKFYLAKERNDYHAHLSVPHFDSISQFTTEIQRQMANCNKQLNAQYGLLFFQRMKRNKLQQKLHALKILYTVFIQWYALYKEKNPSLTYHDILLEKNNVISGILHPHLDVDAQRNRERIIKCVQTYVLTHYPDAFKSFHREQGSVVTLFKQTFDLMRAQKAYLSPTRKTRPQGGM